MHALSGEHIISVVECVSLHEFVRTLIFSQLITTFKKQISYYLMVHDAEVEPSEQESSM